MILVDVMVPCLDKKYDFWLNEKIEIRLVIEELAEVIGQSEKSPLSGAIEELQLCDMKRRRVLIKQDTIVSAGIKTGDTLTLL